MLAFLKGFNANVWILMVLELFERLAYYGATFTLSTFSMYMLSVSMSTMNVLVNLMYVLSPLAALIGGGMSDGKWGRKWVLLFGSVAYTLGLSAVASSAMPWLYGDFPYEPSVWALVTLCGGLALLSVGYGCMKVCLAPLLADCALVSMGRCCTAAHCGPAAGGSAADDADGGEEHEDGDKHDGDGFVPIVASSAASATSSSSRRSNKKSTSAAVSQKNGCQCGCQEGGVCGCNQVVTEERNKAFEHVIGNARQSLVQHRRTTTSASSNNGYGGGRESFGPGVSVDGGHDGTFDYGSGNEVVVPQSAAAGTRRAGGGGCCGGGVRKETVLNTSIPSSSASNQSRPATVGSGSSDAAEENDDAYSFASRSSRNSHAPLMAGDGDAAAIAQADLEDAMEDEASSLLSRLFRLDYFVINFGSIIGIAGAPFLRDADPRMKRIVDTDDGGKIKEVHVGYYIGFWVCAAATLVGTLIYLARLRHYPMNQPSRTMLIVKVSWASVKGRWLYGKLQRGAAAADITALVPSSSSPSTSMTLSPEEQMALAESFFDAHLSPVAPRADEWVGPRLIRYAQFEGFVAEALAARSRQQQQQSADAAGSSSVSSGEAALLESSNSNAIDGHVTSEEARSFALTLALCVSFSPLPVYWLLATQFSSNVVMQSEWMDMPANLPPEIFNNVNTATILVLIPLMDVILVNSRFKTQRISVVGRMTLGFMLMLASMGFCAVLQFIIARRGTFVSDSNYVLNDGESLISALWLIVPFVLQGAAAVFVDTTSIEAAYTAAPTNMKSTVMAVYLLASAASGFLGLAFAPFISADNMAAIMIILCGLQLFVTMLFWVLSNGCNLCCWKQSAAAGGARRKKAVIERLHS